jgi:DNA-binding transcriptional regulator YiaG
MTFWKRQEVEHWPGVASTKMELMIGGAKVTISVRSRHGMKTRRMIMRMILRQLKPLYRELSGYRFLHSDAQPRFGTAFAEDPEPSFRQTPDLLGVAGNRNHEVHPGIEIRIKRFEAGLSLDELAAAARVSPKHLSRVEHGQHLPRAGTVSRILEVLAGASRAKGDAR